MNIQALIVEDEQPAASHLMKLLEEIRYDVNVLRVTDSVVSTLRWLEQNPHPDVIFLDIQLSDGLSFELFRHASLNCPVIFTTAFEEYAIQAFKVNSIDYLLKPIKKDDLEFALDKFVKHSSVNNNGDSISKKVDQMIRMMDHRYKSRFIVKTGFHVRSIETQNILFFYSLGKATFLYDKSGKSYDIEYSLDKLEDLLNPDDFFRINRKYIIHFKAIEDILNYSGNRLQVVTKGSGQEDMIVSRSRIKEFKQWLER